MKKLLIGILLLALGVGLFAEAGLLGLWYGQDYNSAKMALEGMGCTLTKENQNTRDFNVKNPVDCCNITLYLDEKQSLAGWMLTFVDNFPESREAEVFNQCIKLHGSNYKILTDDNMIGWNLNQNRSLRLGFNENNKLKIAMYMDENQPDLFSVTE